MKYFLLIGQSNMAGRGIVTEVPPIKRISRTEHTEAQREKKKISI